MKCPTVVDWTDAHRVDAAKSCINQVRAIFDSIDDLVDLNALFDVQVIDIDQPACGEDDYSKVRVTLLKKKATSAITNTKTDDIVRAPLILYIHGGAFTIRGSKKTLAAQLFGSLLQIGEEDSDVANNSAKSFIDDAVWAVVDYRLAPEHKYPAATEDCLLALNYLVKEMNLGRGGIHVSGVSAGGTLAMEVTLKSLDVEIDSFYVDEPMIPLPSGDHRSWSLDSDSFRRYSYTRNPPVGFLEWSLKAMTGMETNPHIESKLTYGMITTDVDITGGAIDPEQWKYSFHKSNSTLLPRLFLVTSKGDPLKDGGLYFKRVYQQVISQVDAAARNNTERQAQIKYIDSSAGHTGFYYLEKHVFKDIMTEWYAEMRKAHSKRHLVGY